MTKVVVLGAGGQIAQWVIKMLADLEDMELTLFLRNARRIQEIAPKSSKIVEGDVLDAEQLSRALRDQDVVYANLAGEVDAGAKNIVGAMHATGVERLIFIASLGIYNEIPGKFGEWNRRRIGSYLGPYRKAANIIEASQLRYTILRPAWLTDNNEVDYETTRKNEPFKGTEVSRKSVAALVVGIIQSPELWVRDNLGVNKPGTEGDRPAFM